MCIQDRQPLPWEPALDGGWMMISGRWEARVSPAGAGWVYLIWHCGARVAEGRAVDAALAQSRCLDRIRGVVPCAPRRRQAADDLGPSIGRKRCPGIKDRILAALAAGPLTAHELAELLGTSPGAVIQAVSRARRSRSPIRYRHTGELGCGVYELQAEEVAS